MEQVKKKIVDTRMLEILKEILEGALAERANQILDLRAPKRWYIKSAT